MCRSVLVESAFAAADVPVYDSTLYEGGASLSTADNILRVGRELGLCSDDADTNALVTRGEAAIILHAVLTQSFRIEEPPVPVTLVNAAGVNVNDFLLELRKVPEQILDAFNATGWTYRIDFDYISELSKQLNMSCIGATNYSQKTIVDVIEVHTFKLFSKRRLSKTISECFSYIFEIIKHYLTPLTLI